MKKKRIIIGGFIGLYPTGGVTWDYIQYVLGLHLLGHDVYYVEDTMQYSRYQLPGQNWDDASATILYLRSVMNRFGLSERWAYRDIASGECFGLTDAKLTKVIATADIFINVSAATYLRDEYQRVPVRVLIDSDPMFTQVQDWRDDVQDESYQHIRERYSWYSHLFTFGENLGMDDCRVPLYDLHWEITRQPICLDYWKYSAAVATSQPSFTSVMNWSTRKKMIYRQEEWGQKDVEFKKYIDVPQKMKEANFSVVMAVSKDLQHEVNKAGLNDLGWNILCPQNTIATTDAYQQFIQQSTGEFSVAKEAYVKSRSGWFSCRSACYLASGRPVVTQDTGWSKFIPSGGGLFAFNDAHTAVDALKAVASDTKKHGQAARRIAEEYFDSNIVLSELLKRL